MSDTRAYKVVRQELRALLYLRLSDLRDDDLDDDGAGKTFSDREEDLRDLVEHLGGTVVEVVIENDLTKRDGKHRNASAFKRRSVTLKDGTKARRVVRPGFDKIIGYLETGYANLLVTEDSDRITRDPYDGMRLLDIVEARKLNVRTLTGAFTLTDGGTDTEIGAAWDAINKANQESRRIANRVRRGRKRKARKGEFGGGRRPFGFEADGLTPIWHEHAVIFECSRRVLQLDGRKGQNGKPTALKLLAAELREADVPTVTGAPWSATSLRSILLRPRNAGILVHNGEEFKRDAFPAAVPEPMFRAVVQVLRHPSRRTNSDGAAPKWLGSGLYLCGVCVDGTTCKVGVGTEKSPRYQCSKRAHLTRNRASVDKFVVDTVIDRLSRPDAIALFAPVAEDIDADALRAEVATIRATLNQMAKDRVHGRIDQEQFNVASEEGHARIAEINAQLTAAVVDSPLLPLLSAEDVTAAWEAQPLIVQRAIIDTLFTITINRAAGPGGRRFDPRTVDISPKSPASVPPSEGDPAALIAA